MHWGYISGQGTPWRLSCQARVMVALRGRPACGGSAALIHPITCFLVSLPFPSAKACGNRRASRWAKLSTCSRIGCHSGDGFWEQMGTKPPAWGGISAEGTQETQGFTVVGLILWARGPRFRSAECDGGGSIFAPLTRAPEQCLENRGVSIAKNGCRRRYVLYLQSTCNFPSWTSRVRSPSPAPTLQR